ncbi:SCO family protein [uncultured Ferrimonas sp.]|uniref:SCO family protein n=1 Tax=uncultured Ferrimonas sp. TaxID=432640 RepID=UPI00260A0717|nr:SCO family protein [uncultured Ferrimonas sp.]
MNLRVLLLAFAAVVALGAGVWWSLQTPPRPAVAALWLQQPRALAAVELVDQRNQAFGMEQLQGKWTLLFVGYTSCPDVCPTTMADLARLYPKLQSIQQGPQPLQIAMLSVDPQRDNLTRLSNYVRFFNDDFIALTGEHSQLHPFTQSLGLVYALVDSPSGSEYLVDHSADMVLINPQGQLEVIFRPQGEPGQVRTVSMAQLEHELPLIIHFAS